MSLSSCGYHVLRLSSPSQFFFSVFFVLLQSWGAHARIFHHHTGSGGSNASGPLSTGAIIAICVVLVVIVLVIAYIFYKKSQDKRRLEEAQIKQTMEYDHLGATYPLQSGPLVQDGVSLGYKPSYLPFSGILRQNDYAPLGEAPPGHYDCIEGPAMPVASHQRPY